MFGYAIVTLLELLQLLFHYYYFFGAAKNTHQTKNKKKTKKKENKTAIVIGITANHFKQKCIGSDYVAYSEFHQHFIDRIHCISHE